MRVLLASCELDAAGDQTAVRRALTALVAPAARAAIVLNACDGEPDEDRRGRLERERTSLGALGETAVELDLRQATGPASTERLAAVLDRIDLLWVGGGSAHALNAAIAATGFAALVRARVASGALVWAGYSAGAMIAGPPLYGETLAIAPRGVGETPVWGGLGLVELSIVPHVAPGSDHVRVAEALSAAGHRCAALADGQAIVIDARGERLISPGSSCPAPE